MAQIVAMQCLYYVALSFTLMILDQWTDTPPSLAQIFDAGSLHVADRQGWCVVVGFLITMGCGAVILYFVVERAKMCADFAATVHIIHLMACWGFSGSIPASLTWWFINVTSGAVMAVLGEYLCMLKEMEDIPRSSNTLSV